MDFSDTYHTHVTYMSRFAMAMGFFNKLPEDCIAHIFSLTSPQDACRLSLVSSTFRLVADSDDVWEAFLPSDYKEVIARALPFSPPPTTKDLFFHLSNKPLIIDNGTKSFCLEKRSGKKCYMLSSRDLAIVWSDDPKYWTFTSLPESRFPEVAKLLYVCWLEIRGKLSTKMLSPNTLYGVYLVYNFTSNAYGMEYHPGEVSCGIVGGACKTTQTVLLDHRTINERLTTENLGRFRNRNPKKFRILTSNSGDKLQQQQQSKKRTDGWMEIKMGEYLKRGLDEEDCDGGDLEMSFMEVKAGIPKGGLIVEGIEIRPI